jgi:dihydrofolate reductase
MAPLPSAVAAHRRRRFRSTTAAGLIDEYRLLTFPVVLGTGERLFPAGGPPACLECLSAEQAGAAVLTWYRRAAR